MSGRRHDKTGRSTAQFMRRDAEFFGPSGIKSDPDQVAIWGWYPLEVRHSKAWRAMSDHARRAIELLELEHHAHMGRSNGSLVLTFDQAVAAGIPRAKFAAAVRELTYLGLVTVIHGKRTGARNAANSYRLTYFNGADWTHATNGWKRITDEDVKRLKTHYHEITGLPKSESKFWRSNPAGSGGGTNPVQAPELSPEQAPERESRKSAISDGAGHGSGVGTPLHILPGGRESKKLADPIAGKRIKKAGSPAKPDQADTQGPAAAVLRQAGGVKSPCPDPIPSAVGIRSCAMATCSLDEAIDIGAGTGICGGALGQKEPSTTGMTCGADKRIDS